MLEGFKYKVKQNKTNKINKQTKSEIKVRYPERDLSIVCQEYFWQCGNCSHALALVCSVEECTVVHI